MVKKFIFNADDFGLCKAINKAVFEGYQSGLLKSVSLVANGEGFEEAINTILPQCPDLGVGIHLNVIEGLSLCQDPTSLVNSDGRFENSFFKLFIKAYNPKEKEFMAELEREFRLQIEKIMSKTKVTHIDSHLHIHAIPKIFDLVCRLAKEYGIKQVRTHFEKLYIVPDVKKHISIKYLINFLKNIMFGFFTIFNDGTIHKYELKTNDYVIGLLYTSMMDALTVSYGIIPIQNKEVEVETIIHPSRYEDGTINNRFDEFLLIKNKKLRAKIEKLGFEITNYVEKES